MGEPARGDSILQPAHAHAATSSPRYAQSISCNDCGKFPSCSNDALGSCTIGYTAKGSRREPSSPVIRQMLPSRLLIVSATHASRSGLPGPSLSTMKHERGYSQLYRERTGSNKSFEVRPMPGGWPSLTQPDQPFPISKKRVNRRLGQGAVRRAAPCPEVLRCALGVGGPLDEHSQDLVARIRDSRGTYCAERGFRFGCGHCCHFWPEYAMGWGEINAQKSRWAIRGT